MKRHVVVLFVVVFSLIFLNPMNAKGNTYTTVYSYYRAPDPNSHAKLSVSTLMDTQIAIGEGGFLPSYASGHEPSILQRAYDESNHWDWLWPPQPSPWAFLTSERAFESGSNLTFDYAYPIPCYVVTSGCGYSPNPYPAQNPFVDVFGYARPGDLKVGGATKAGATGVRMPPVAKAAVVTSIKNSFTVLPGTSSKEVGDTVQLFLKFRLNGMLSAETGAHSLMGASLAVTKGSETAASVNGSGSLYNQSQGQTSGSCSLAYSTNTGTNSSLNLSATPSSCVYDAGLFTLNFDALVGSTYDVNLSLNLLSQSDGSTDWTLGIAASHTDFSNYANTFAAKITGDNGVVLSWTVPPVPAATDFDADGNTDILWRNTTDGRNAAWFMDAMTVTGLALLDNMTDQNWTIVGTGDFNNDSRTDILWRNTTNGQNAVWFMNGTTVTGFAVLDNMTDQNWKIVGTGDFNKDGRVDILWRNTTDGQNAVWFMNGTTVTGFAVLDSMTDQSWQIVGTGDFNKDGRVDILWRNAANGQNAVWFMNGTTVTGFAVLDNMTDQSWQIVGAEDFNNDGKVDILWRNTIDGRNAVWFMDGMTFTGITVLDSLTDLSWTIVSR